MFTFITITIQYRNRNIKIEIIEKKITDTSLYNIHNSSMRHSYSCVANSSRPEVFRSDYSSNAEICGRRFVNSWRPYARLRFSITWIKQTTHKSAGENAEPTIPKLFEHLASPGPPMNTLRVHWTALRAFFPGCFRSLSALARPCSLLAEQVPL